LDGLREWTPNRPVSKLAADHELIRESFEKQPVRTVAEAANARYQRNAVAQGLATQSGITCRLWNDAPYDDECQKSTRTEIGDEPGFSVIVCASASNSWCGCPWTLTARMGLPSG